MSGTTSCCRYMLLSESFFDAARRILRESNDWIAKEIWLASQCFYSAVAVLPYYYYHYYDTIDVRFCLSIKRRLETGPLYLAQSTGISAQACLAGLQTKCRGETRKQSPDLVVLSYSGRSSCEYDRIRHSTDVFVQCSE